MATVTTDLSITKFAQVQARYPSTSFPMNATTWYAPKTATMFDSGILLGLSAWPASLKHNKLLGAQFRLQVKNDSYSSSSFRLASSVADFNASTVTWNTMPSYTPNAFASSFPAGGSGGFSGDAWIPSAFTGTDADAIRAFNLLQGVSFMLTSNDDDVAIKTVLAGGGTPYAHIYYDDAVKVPSTIVYASGPASGYSNPRNATSFSWTYVKNSADYCAIESWNQSSATFYWKTSSAGSYTGVSAGAAKSVTIPANTFPAASTIQWYVVGTDEEGTTTQTPVYSFSTAAGAVSTACVDPVGQVIDGSAPYTFQWTIESTDGQPASRTIFQWKQTSGDTWATLFDVNSAVTSYTVPGGTFSAGSIDWQILAYNIDGTLGTYAPASFVSVAAPDAVQGLAATAVPFSTISWQSTGQEAYQITIDGKEIVKAYGPSVYSYQLTEPLEDGEHTIVVTIQGVYGLWSQPSEITVNIENVPAQAVVLTGTFGVDAVLYWDVPFDVVYIYRDGKRIGATTGQTFTDRLSLGYHNYYIISPLPDGNYNKSNTIDGTTQVDCSYISLLSGGNWLELEHCKELPMQTYTSNRTVTVRHYCGAVYPVAEVSTYYDKSGSFNVLFEDDEDITVNMLEGLLGEMVVMKNRRGNLLVGIFSQIDKRVENFYVDCDFIVQQTEWNDFVDETDN